LVAQEYMDVPKRIHRGQVNMAKNNTISSDSTPTTLITKHAHRK